MLVCTKLTMSERMGARKTPGSLVLPMQPEPDSEWMLTRGRAVADCTVSDGWMAYHLDCWLQREKVFSLVGVFTDTHRINLIYFLYLVNIYSIRSLYAQFWDS